MSQRGHNGIGWRTAPLGLRSGCGRKGWSPKPAVQACKHRIAPKHVDSVTELGFMDACTPVRIPRCVVAHREGGSARHRLHGISEGSGCLSIPPVCGNERSCVEFVPSVHGRLEHENGVRRLSWRCVHPGSPLYVGVCDHPALVVGGAQQHICRQMHHAAPGVFVDNIVGCCATAGTVKKTSLPGGGRGTVDPLQSGDLLLCRPRYEASLDQLRPARQRPPSGSTQQSLPAPEWIFLHRPAESATVQPGVAPR